VTFSGAITSKKQKQARDPFASSYFSNRLKLLDHYLNKKTVGSIAGFDLIEKIGSGGFGDIFIVKDTDDSGKLSLFVVKTLRSNNTSFRESIGPFFKRKLVDNLKRESFILFPRGR